jgi:hypothetical protein
MFSTEYRVTQKDFYAHPYTSMWAPVVARQFSKHKFHKAFRYENISMYFCIPLAQTPCMYIQSLKLLLRNFPAQCWSPVHIKSKHLWSTLCILIHFTHCTNDTVLTATQTFPSICCNLQKLLLHNVVSCQNGGYTNNPHSQHPTWQNNHLTLLYEQIDNSHKAVRWITVLSPTSHYSNISSMKYNECHKTESL